MGDSKRPSTSSLRRFISSRPYVTISEIRRRFGLETAEAVTRVALNGTCGYVGLPQREAQKLEELWVRNEIGLEFSAEVNAPVVVGVYPIRIARFLVDHARPSQIHEPAPAERKPIDPAPAADLPGVAERPARAPQPGFAGHPAASSAGQGTSVRPATPRPRRSSRRSRRR